MLHGLHAGEGHGRFAQKYRNDRRKARREGDELLRIEQNYKEKDRENQHEAEGVEDDSGAQGAGFSPVKDPGQDAFEPDEGEGREQPAGQDEEPGQGVEEEGRGEAEDERPGPTISKGMRRRMRSSKGSAKGVSGSLMAKSAILAQDGVQVNEIDFPESSLKGPDPYWSYLRMPRIREIKPEATPSRVQMISIQGLVPSHLSSKYPKKSPTAMEAGRFSASELRPHRFR